MRVCCLYCIAAALFNCAPRNAGVKNIITAMRKPGPGMTPFDEKVIPDKTAEAIAEYIAKTFK
jgi:hypothetical protein